MGGKCAEQIASRSKSGRKYANTPPAPNVGAVERVRMGTRSCTIRVVYDVRWCANK